MDTTRLTKLALHYLLVFLLVMLVLGIVRNPPATAPVRS
jgi:hypothetical protein